MRKIRLFTLVFLVVNALNVFSQTGDTITVQTFTFGAPQNAWFVFPSDTIRFEKILMQYTLKCNPAQNPACGEWDYLTYSYLYDHTGLFDSSLVHQPTYVMNGGTPSSVMYMNTPSYTYNTHWQYNTVNTATTTVNNYTVGTGNTNDTNPFGSGNSVSRSQYLWKASEMTGAGMAAGNITGLKFYLQSLGSTLNNLTVRIKTVTLDSLTQATFVNTGFTSVYSQNTTFASTGWNTLQLTTPFNWNGTSNLLIEVMYDNDVQGTNNVVTSSTTTNKSGLINSGNDRCAAFHSAAYVEVPVNDKIAAIDSFVTVAFWAYGTPQFQPSDGSCFEALDSLGNRVLNSHTPWSDGKNYWDAGNEGGYDRLIRVLSVSQYEGQWNYWTFTKNVETGAMKVYLNGVLLQNASGKVKRMKGIKKFRIGRGIPADGKTYEGRMDEFAVFNTELSLATIQQYYKKKLDANHPNYSNLALYYQFDDGNYITASDSAPGNHALASFMAGANNPLKSAIDLVGEFTSTTLRPNIIFEQGVFTSHLDSTLVVDSVMNAPITIVQYNDSIVNPGVSTDTLHVWPIYYNNYVYNAQGVAIDSSLVTPDDTLTLAYYNWYNKFPQKIRYELARYITPYGNGLSLGNGWTWTFDVSDYRTLLADSVHLEAGNWQELLDMKFLMIKGVPPRDVLGIQNLWTGSFDYGHSNDPIETHLTPKSVTIPANAANTRWKSRVTGHGMDTPQNCAEFCPKTHYYKVNGAQKFSKQVWRDNCDLNPLYPQGGTWVYDRANWCPGAEVWTYDFELTPHVTPGATVSLDHDVQNYTNNGEWSYYQIEDQVVSYSAPNFSLDAAMENILSPSKDQMWMRYNPICTNPVIRIKNTGTTTLTSLTITYGVTGATQSVYNWTGNLAFLQTQEITLGNFARTVGATEFVVTLSAPNGGADQYANNNTMKSYYEFTPELPSPFVIELKTNSIPSENSYTVKNSSGTIVHQRSGMSPNTTYRDTMNLPLDCYVFELVDLGEDGLTWWANTSQGSGTLKFKNGTSGAVLKTFNSDFGGQVYQQFTVAPPIVGQKDYIFTSVNTLNVFPTPGNGNITINVDMNKRQNGSIEITDLLGKVVYTYSFINQVAESIDVNLSNATGGVYIVKLKTDSDILTKRIIIQK
ncbi:MAG TPA: peptide-N-glycosidase F-related protein [Bacteroidia bacterium]